MLEYAKLTDDRYNLVMILSLYQRMKSIPAIVCGDLLMIKRITQELHKHTLQHGYATIIEQTLDATLGI